MLKYHLDDRTELASRNRKFIDRSVSWMTERLGIGKGTRVCDLGCGPGLYATRLTGLGATVTGVDFSENSLKYARQAAVDAGLDVTFVHADYLEQIPPGRFDLITLIYCDFCALSPGQRRKLLGEIRKSLEPGGQLLFDVCSMRLFEESEESSRVEKYPDGGFWTGKPHYVFVSVFKYAQEILLLHKHTIIEQRRSRDIYNWIQCFSPALIEAELNSAGFNLVECFGNVAGDTWENDSKEIAVVACLRS